jgi:hypothetical protein
MDSREFVRFLKHETIDETVRIVLKRLESPRLPQPVPQSVDDVQTGISNFYNSGALEEQKQAAWFRTLNEEQQGKFVEILQDCAELSAFSFCTLIDGVGCDYEETFDLFAIDAKGRRTLVNPQNSDMLHDLLSEVCAEELER